jgi:hypothetical protein
MSPPAPRTRLCRATDKRDEHAPGHVLLRLCYVHPALSQRWGVGRANRYRRGAFACRSKALVTRWSVRRGAKLSYKQGDVEQKFAGLMTASYLAATWTGIA